MKPYDVYVTRMIPQVGIDMLSEIADVRVNPDDRPLSRDELHREIAAADGVVGLLSDPVDAAFFEAAKNLKGYANYAVGFDNIDVAEATRRNIPVSNTPGVLTTATAECAWALMFAVARRVVEADAVMRSGKWDGWGPLQFLGGDVKGRTLGVVGAGRIGTETGLMSRGFDMDVLYTSRSGRVNETLRDRVNGKLVSFDELLERSDFISVNTPLTPDTRHLFEAAAFKRMKRSAYLINTARGPVVDEAALVDALKSGEIAGAGLDVYEKEPRMADGLADLDNVVVLPHIGSATALSRDDMAKLAARNLMSMLKGEEPETCLNPELFS